MSKQKGRSSTPRRRGRPEKSKPEPVRNIKPRPSWAADQEEAAREVFSHENLPIDDPFAEKEVIEDRGTFGYANYLTEKLASALGKRFSREEPGPYFSLESGEARISEVYRRCYESKEELHVLSDFVGHYPALAMSCGWLADLIKHHTTFTAPLRGSLLSRLLSAMERGFRKAANPGRQALRQNRAVDLMIAKSLQLDFQARFTNFLRSPQFKRAVEDERNDLVLEYIQNLTRSYPILAETSPETFDKVADHLRGRRARKASVFFVHKLMKVSKHDLQSKSKVNLYPLDTAHFPPQD